MKILVINPNGSTTMTVAIAEQLDRIRHPETDLSVVTTVGAPLSIQSARDAALATPPMLKMIERANEEGVDAIVIACFSDPGLEAAKEVSAALVLGIEETTVHIASMLGHKYTILTPLAVRIASKEQDVRRFKADPACASVRALGMTVLETERDPERTKERILRIAERAMEEDGTEVLILGCAGMTGYAQDVERSLGVVVLDPTAVTFKVAEALAALGIRHCKKGLFSFPTAA